MTAHVTDGAEVCPEWYALRLRSNRERAVRDALRAQSIEEFLPTYTEATRWSDRQKVLERPLFPGYIFARFPRSDALRIVRIAGVVRLLPSSLQPGAIDAAQIESVRRVCESRLPLLPCPYVAGDTVTVDSGALAGLTGVIQRTRGTARIVVRVEILHRAVSVEIDAGNASVSHADMDAGMARKGTK
jgi:transcription antitermination factor NusG